MGYGARSAVQLEWNLWGGFRDLGIFSLGVAVIFGGLSVWGDGVS